MTRRNLDRGLPTQKLNEHGAVTISSLKFGEGKLRLPNRLRDRASRRFGPYGPAVATASVTKVFDARGAELFEFNRDGRKTDEGAANATAKEIIKRLQKLRSAG